MSKKLSYNACITYEQFKKTKTMKDQDHYGLCVLCGTSCEINSSCSNRFYAITGKGLLIRMETLYICDVCVEEKYDSFQLGKAEIQFVEGVFQVDGCHRMND